MPKVSKRRTPARKRSKAPKRKMTITRRRPRIAAPVKRPRKSTFTISPEIRRQLAVFHDPFSKATSQPKIPDGKAGYSIGMCNQQVREIVNREDSFTTMHFCLFPGKGAGVSIYNVEAPVGTPAASSSVLSMGYNDHGALNLLNLANGSSGDAVPIRPQDNFAKWRIVSQGLRLKLLNVEDENDGWWEACRLTEANNPGDFALSPKDNSTDRQKGVMSPSVSFMAGLAFTNIVDQKSYTTGRLKDIHKHQFELHPLGDENDFQQSFEETEIEIGNDTVGTYQNDSCLLRAGRAATRDMYNSEIDSSMDMVYIRIHCRPNQSTSNVNNGSRLLAHLVGNQEIIYGLSQKESKYHTESHEIGSKMEAQSSLKRASVKPDTPVSMAY